MTRKELEKYSSAYTLSDMEIFIFPELFYSLVLANIMSPEIWKWREDPWFKSIEKKSFNQKINRIKQYIIDHYVFNLDLDTWGLTTKEKEIGRFSSFIDTELLKQSNALFGYEGDKYYFSIDIRKHFGLDKYTDNTIPYWKTETVEAMSAFKYMDGYTTGAGECVSLSSLYAAALFIVGKIPLEKIYLIATPLHSQNYIDVKNGILTNNRRLVTKNMWYNGTSLSAKARRAIENEKITIVSHISGLIHTLYDEASIDKDAYGNFKSSIQAYLTEEFTPTSFINYLRTRKKFWKCFQFKHKRNNKDQYISMETLFCYEHSSKNTLHGDSRNALLNEVDPEEFSFARSNSKILFNEMEKFLKENSELNFEDKQNYIFKELLSLDCSDLKMFFHDYREWLQTKPKLPDDEKQYISEPKLVLSPEMPRNEIISEIYKRRDSNSYAHYAIYAYRDMEGTDWDPFMKAAIERNPVCFEDCKKRSNEEIYELLSNFSQHSIYEGKRLAQPDEVWNFKTGDGIEKAITMAAILINLNPSDKIKLQIKKQRVKLVVNKKTYNFVSEKDLTKEISVQ
ncbi:MAG: hypothetical protein C0594_12100 [Marinilabiliales bacterium]|nr:MAG: hypothetical protein C0594_12100 [Marinilabiliales bacterium]